MVSVESADGMTRSASDPPLGGRVHNVHVKQALLSSPEEPSSSQMPVEAEHSVVFGLMKILRSERNPVSVYSDGDGGLALTQTSGSSGEAPQRDNLCAGNLTT